MSQVEQESRDLTPHQKRVLAALLALTRTYEHRWWTRHAIGQVVGAGGYHGTIQRRTMLSLYEADLVMLEAESWPDETKALVRCNCGCHAWGLTHAGTSAAEELHIRLSEPTREAIKQTKWETINWLERSLDRIHGLDDDDDDDPADHWKRGE